MFTLVVMNCRITIFHPLGAHHWYSIHEQGGDITMAICRILGISLTWTLLREGQKGDNLPAPIIS